MAEATERWSVSNCVSLGQNDINHARREWDVIAASDEREALFAANVARRGEQHIRWPDLRARSVSAVSKPGPTTYIIAAMYDNISGASEEDGDLQDWPSRIAWNTSLAQEPIEQDIDGNPITNSAGEPFDNLVQETTIQLQLTVKRWEFDFDPGFAMEMMNTININSFNIATGRRSFPVAPRTAKIVRIQPTQEYTLDSDFVEIEYVFEFREEEWDRRIMDVGRHQRFLSISGKYEITNEILKPDSDTPITFPVPLDGVGLALEKKWRGATKKGGGKPWGATIEDTDHAVFLRYATLRRTNFNKLGL